MLISLHLKNFRRHEALNLQFNSGLNGLFGKNYAGKSAVLLAIAVAIGGPGWARGFRLARRGTDNFEIQLVMEINGERYRVLRTKSAAKLFRIGQEDKLIATAQGQVNIELGKILGMPVDRWLELRFVRQKQAATLFEAGSAKLNLMVEELTGVNAVSRVIDWLGTESKAVANKIDALLPQLTPVDQLAAQHNRLQELQSSLPQVASQLEQLEAQLAALEAVEDETPQIDALVREIKAARDLQAKRSRLQAQLEGLYEQARALDPADQADIGELEKQIAEESSTLGEWREWLPRVQTAIRLHSLAQHAYAEASANPVGELMDVDALEARAAEAEKVHDDARQAEAAIADSLARAKDLVKQLTKQLESGICTGCNRPFEDQDQAHRDALQARLNEAKVMVTTNAEDLQSLANETKKAAAALQAARGLVREAAKHNQAVELHAGKVNAAKESLGVAKADLDAAQEMAPGVTVADGQGEAQRIEALIRQLTTKLNKAKAFESQDQQLGSLQAQVTAQIDALGEVPTQDMVEALEAKGTKLRDARSQRNSTISLKSHEVVNLRTQIATAEREVGYITGMLGKAEQLSAEVARLESRQSEIDGFRKYLRDNRSRYLQRAWDLILGRASTFAAAITEGHITAITRTEAGAFQFIEQGEEAEVTDASGAQAAILGLGVQVALAETLPTHLDVFLADEPTADMDAEHSSAALMGLSAVSGQALVISHHRMDESICSQVSEL